MPVEKGLAVQFLLAAANWRLFGARRPFFVSWRITNHCTRRCLYCDRTRETAQELDLPTARRLLREMAQAGAKWLNLTGGEPLLWPGALDLIREALNLGLKVSINTNGDLLPEMIHEVPRELEIGLSLDGPEEVQDALRGPGAFAATLKALAAARQRGCAVGLNCVLSRLNCDALPFVLATAEEHGVEVLFQRIFPTAMGSDRGHDLAPSAVQLDRALSFLAAEIDRGSPFVANSREGLSHQGDGADRVVPRCVAGSLAARITPEGELSACWGRAVDDQDRVSCLADGFAAAFRDLGPKHCARCRCAKFIEGNLGLGLSPVLLWRRYVQQEALAQRVNTRGDDNVNSPR